MSPTGPAPSRSPVGAALLSFLWPGLGHAYLRHYREAALFALPPVALTLLLLTQLVGGIETLVFRALDAAIVQTLIVLIVLMGAWRILAMTHAFMIARPMDRAGRPAGRAARTGRERWSVVAVAGLTAAVVASHGLFAWGGFLVQDASTRIFVGGRTGGDGPDREPSNPDVGPLPTPYETPPTPEERVTILLVGVDSGLGYRHSLSDTMMVVSLDPETGDVAMLSLPRDLGRFPLYDGGTYDGRLNSLLTTAARNPDRYPDGGLGTLSREIGFLLGIPIHYYALIDLAGFKTMIDAVGGVTVVNERAIADAGYKFPDGKVGFYLPAGPQRLDGRTALAYVRSRGGAGDNDFTRARRQQQLLIALRAQLTSPAMIPSLPALLDAVARTVDTSLPPTRLEELYDAAKRIDDETITRKVLGPPFATRAAGTSTYILVPDMERFRRLSIELFGDDSAYASSD